MVLYDIPNSSRWAFNYIKKYIYYLDCKIINKIFNQTFLTPFGILHATSSSDEHIFDEFLMLIGQQLIAPPGFEAQSDPPQVPHSWLQQTSSLIIPFLQNSKLTKEKSFPN